MRHVLESFYFHEACLFPKHTLLPACVCGHTQMTLSVAGVCFSELLLGTPCWTFEGGRGEQAAAAYYTNGLKVANVQSPGQSGKLWLPLGPPFVNPLCHYSMRLGRLESMLLSSVGLLLFCIAESTDLKNDRWDN